MECVNQLRRRLFSASEPENYIVHNLRTSLSVAEHQRDTAIARLEYVETELSPSRDTDKSRKKTEKGECR